MKLVSGMKYSHKSTKEIQIRSAQDFNYICGGHGYYAAHFGGYIPRTTQFRVE